MFHSSTAEMLSYWRTLKGEALAPARADVNPVDFRQVLSQVFMLGRQAPGDYRFRLAGGLLSELHGQTLRGEDILPLWCEDDRLQIKKALEGVARTAEPIVITAVAEAGSHMIRLEILLAPLANAEGQVDRIIGLYQPLSPIANLNERPVQRLIVSRIAKALDAANEDAPRLRLAALEGRLVG